MEEYSRKIRIEYYQVVKAPLVGIGADYLFKLEALILKASTLSILERTKQYYQEDARLDKYIYNKVDDYWYLNFVRLRQTKLPVRANKTSTAVPFKLAIDEYIGEDVNAVYDCSNHILALQRNRDSLSSSGLEQYLTEIYNSPNEGIYLRPIPIMEIDDKINKAKIYRKLKMRFATKMENTRVNLKGSSFESLFNYFDKFNANTATVSVSLGHVKKGTLDEETIHETISDIFNLEGIFEGAELSLKNSEIEPVDTIDLFTTKYHGFITVKLKKLESLDFEFMAEQIHIKYNNSKKDILLSIL